MYSVISILNRRNGELPGSPFAVSTQALNVVFPVADLADEQTEVVQQATQDDQGTGNGKQHQMLELDFRADNRMVVTKLG